MIARVAKNPRSPILLGAPINWRSSLNRGLVSWWLCLPPQMGGAVWRDLAGLNPGALTSMGNASNGWRDPGGRPGGMGSLTFAGSPACVDCGRIPQMEGATQLTMCCWNYIAVNTRQASFGKSTLTGDVNKVIGFELGGGAIYFEPTSSGSNYGSFTGTLTGWHHYAMVFDGTQSTNATRLKGYIDGVQKTLAFVGTVAAATSATATGDLFVGKLYDGGFVFTLGSHDDARVFTVAKSAAEIFDLYNDSIQGYPRTLNRIGRRFGTPKSGGLSLERRRKAVCGI